jgi:hypothetical protein
MNISELMAFTYEVGKQEINISKTITSAKQRKIRRK